MNTISRLVFGFAGLFLAIFSVTLIAYSAYSVATAKQSIEIAALDAIGYVVIAIAVFDVAKYLIDEEVIREREMRRAGEARRSLTRFLSTVIIAVMLEAIVITSKVSKGHIPDLVYPVLLALTGVAILVGLGVFQRLSAVVETTADEKPEKRPRSKD